MIRWVYRDRYAGQKYRKLPHHQKKENKNNQREVWRQSTGIYKDKAKSCPYYSKRKVFCKKLSSRYHRRWVKTCIQREQWDNLHSFQEEKVFRDPWMWS